MYKKYILKNGLTIIGEELPYLKSISLGIHVNAGSRIEKEEISGVSHFIEHMLFKGTKSREAKQIASEIDNLGGQINAYTSKESTCYYVHLLDDHIDTGIDLLSDMLLNSKFNEEDINKERLVIIEELKMYEDSPEDLVYDLLIEQMYKTDGLGMNIIGTVESLKNIDREKMLEYFKTYYVPNNAVISICGNFKFEEIVKKIENKFGNWENKSIEIQVDEAEFNSCTIKREKDIEQVNLAINLKGVGNEDIREVYALAIANNVFGGTISSRLFQKIREEKGLVYSIYSSQTMYRKCGELGIFASMSNENLEEVYELIKKEIEYIQKNMLTEKEIKDSKEQLKGSYMLGLEGTSSRMMSIGKEMLFTNQVKSAEEVLKCIDDIDTKEINEIIQRVFDLDNIAICIVGKDVDKINI